MNDPILIIEPSLVWPPRTAHPWGICCCRRKSRGPVGEWHTRTTGEHTVASWCPLRGTIRAFVKSWMLGNATDGGPWVNLFNRRRLGRRRSSPSVHPYDRHEPNLSGIRGSPKEHVRYQTRITNFKRMVDAFSTEDGTGRVSPPLPYAPHHDHNRPTS